MRLNLRFLVSGTFIFLSSMMNAQINVTTSGCPGVPGACGYHNNSSNLSNLHLGPNYTPQNGNGTLGNIYANTACGLNFSSASQRLGQRFTPVGVAQPAPFVISGIPSCAIILKAYLWAEGSGNGAAQTATVNGPLGSANYPMTIVGSGPDKCWGYSGSYTYRADVTPSCSGNGTYNISGILTNPPSAGNDMDGATLLIVWRDPTQTYSGTIRIDDGAIIVNGGSTTYNMNYPAVCGATTNAVAFMGIGDIQMAVSSMDANLTPVPITWNWWNFEQVNTTVAAGQTTSPYSVATSGDCYNLCIAGLYYRTTCTVCTPASTLTLSTSSTPATCSSCNGTATVSVTPAGAYTYSWSPSGGTGATATGLCPGTYTVTATASCGSGTATVVVPTAGGSITVTNAGVTNATCNGVCNGSATVTQSGGTPPYTYSWAPSGGTGITASSLCAGNYTCTVTDAAGCTGTQSFVITQPPAITTTGTQTNITCNGLCNGTATTNASGGTPPYTYSWVPSGGTGSTAGGLCAGTTTCTVTDANGCTTTQTFNLTQPTAITATSSFVSATCSASNGSATVVPSGGTGPYTYSWSPVAGSAATLPNIPAGVYVCTITDASLCTYTISVTVPNASSPSASILSSTNVTCFGACDGTANVTASGGTLPYSYAWTPSGGTGPGSVGQCPGTYTCTVTDANGCISSAIVTITQPTALSLTSSQVDVSCNAACNGSASVVATGGTPPYTYAWLPSGATGATATALCAGTHTCTVTDANGCSTTQSFTITEPPALTLSAAGFNVSCFGVCDGQIVVIPTGGTPNYTFAWNTGCTSASCNGICAGTYNVTVTDMNGCTATATATVTEPPAITITTSAIDAHCNQSDGSATAVYSGGSGALTPVWYNPSTSGATYSNIPAGNYFVVVTDANGCDDTANVTVNNLPGVIGTLGAVTNVSCFGGNNGSINVTDNGINTPYVYSWSCSASTTNSATNLTAGTCTVTITDAAGCVSTVSTTITQPAQLTVTATATPGAVCAGGTVQLSATGGGGTPAYQYAWMPGSMVGANQNIVPVASGTYSVYITDANLCVDSTTVNITVNANPVALLSGDSLAGCAPLCVNFSDISTLSSGTITQWSWDFGDGNTSTLQNPQHCYTSSGVYDVVLTVTTAAGCSNTITMTNYINVYSNPIASFTAGPQPTTELDPTIYFLDQSTGASMWSWSFGDTTNASSTLQNPSYTYGGSGCYPVVLTVTTSNGCVDTTVQIICIDPDVTLYVPNAFSPNADGVNDYFFPQGIGMNPDKFEMWIFDRWGNMIYYTTSMSQGWDGKVQGHSDVAQEDVYVWKIKAYDVLGHKHNLIGHVTLIK